MEEKVTFVVVNFQELYYRIDYCKQLILVSTQVKSYVVRKQNHIHQRIISPKITKKISTIEPS